ncbi:hypothetical protein PR048_018836 [Dryococelus australis]|uniref:Uncharacterized protein n=1 Tax=Dryococelus australis TaxID=614101 RepID=A0ABQ9H1X6_9NEOP|nr:hypothetical protein PR048_018836 [Dryococelus australis]
MARRHGLTTEQALRYFQDICETNTDSENRDNDLSSGDEYMPQNSDNGADSDEEPEVFQDAEVQQQSQTTDLSVTLERNELTTVQQASQMEVVEVELAQQNDCSQMPSETVTVMQPQGSVASVHAGLPIGDTKVVKDGTEREVIDFGNNFSGRRRAQNVGPTLHVMRQIKDNSPPSAWRLMLTPRILLHIKTCTEQEAHQKLQDDTMAITMTELEAFISIINDRGAYVTKSLELSTLWSSIWRPNFFTQTMT